MKYVYILLLSFVVLSCKKEPLNSRPVWYDTIQDTTINLQLTYHGVDTGENTKDVVFAFGRYAGVSFIDTLTGITSRAPESVYHWSISTNGGIYSYTLMRLIDNSWKPVTSGDVYHNH